MHTKAKGREPVDQRYAVLYRAFGEVKATARGRNMLQQRAWSAPVALGVMISSARPGKGSCSPWTWDRAKAPSPIATSTLRHVPWGPRVPGGTCEQGPDPGLP